MGTQFIFSAVFREIVFSNQIEVVEESVCVCVFFCWGGGGWWFSNSISEKCFLRERRRTIKIGVWKDFLLVF